MQETIPQERIEQPATTQDELNPDMAMFILECVEARNVQGSQMAAAVINTTRWLHQYIKRKAETNGDGK